MRHLGPTYFYMRACGPSGGSGRADRDTSFFLLRATNPPVTIGPPPPRPLPCRPPSPSLAPPSCHPASPPVGHGLPHLLGPPWPTPMSHALLPLGVHVATVEPQKPKLLPTPSRKHSPQHQHTPRQHRPRHVTMPALCSRDFCLSPSPWHLLTPRQTRNRQAKTCMQLLPGIGRHAAFCFWEAMRMPRGKAMALPAWPAGPANVLSGYVALGPSIKKRTQKKQERKALCVEEVMCSYGQGGDLAPWHWLSMVILNLHPCMAALVISMSSPSDRCITHSSAAHNGPSSRILLLAQ